jgi:hypothetical protein
MLGRKERDQLELLITGSLRQLIPDDHVLVRVDRVLCRYARQCNDQEQAGQERNCAKREPE